MCDTTNNEVADMFFSNMKMLFERDELKNEIQRLNATLYDVQNIWRQERSKARALEAELSSVSALLKRLIGLMLMRLPYSIKPLSGKVVRIVWPGFARA